MGTPANPPPRTLLGQSAQASVDTYPYLFAGGHSLPNSFLGEASGQVAYEEEGWRVCPVDSFEDEVVRMASAQLVGSHATKFPEEKILRQRHQVRVVPVTKVNYEWKGKARSFFVYGYENKVYVPDNSYPQSCCWGCCL